MNRTYLGLFGAPGATALLSRPGVGKALILLLLRGHGHVGAVQDFGPLVRSLPRHPCSGVAYTLIGLL